MIKKIIMMMSAAVAMVCVQAATTYTEMVDGIEWTYTVTDGKASVGGGSDSSPAVPISTSGEITIPSKLGDYPVTMIGDCAFYDCSLTSVTIPDSVTSIGYWAFRGCSSLTSVTIPASVTSFGTGAFDGCIIKNATLPGRKMSVSINWSSVTNIVISEGTTEIDFFAFENCSSLTSITIPGSVTNINQGAFSGCSSLTSVTIPYGVTRIGFNAFRDCGSLTSVTIPDSVTSIGSSAFYNCSSLMSVTIPDSVTSIGWRVFGGCGALADSNGFVIVKGVLYDYLGECGDVVIPNSVMRIGYEAFRNCVSLTSVIIPDSVASIEELAFCGCSSLTSVTIPDSVMTIGDYTFDDCSSLTSVTIPDSVTSIGDWAFCGCSSLTSVIIPNSLTSIGRDTFNRCSSLTSVTIPDSVTSIGDYAFYNCSSLTIVTIPEGVTNIGVQALTYCSSLTNIIFHGDAPELIAAFRYVHSDCTAYVKKNSTGWGVDIPGKWQGINIAYLEENDEDGNDFLSGVTNLVTSADGPAALQTAIEAANEGDVILVGPGTYSPIRTNGKKITIKSTDGAANTIIDGGCTNRCATLADDTMGDWWIGDWAEDQYVEYTPPSPYNTTLIGFTLCNGNSYWKGHVEYYEDGSQENVLPSRAFEGGGAFGGVLVDCVVSNNVAEFIFEKGSIYYETDEATGEMVLEVQEEDDSEARGGGVSFAKLYNCLVTKNKATIGGSGIDNCYAYNCTIVGNYCETREDDDFDAVFDVENSEIYNTIMSVTPYWGGGYAMDVGDVKAENCAIVSETGGALPYNYFDECWNGDGDSYSYDFIVGDIKFVNPSIGDYRLQQGSAAIDAGNESYVQPLNLEYGDLDGNIRVRDTVDLGAYECIKEKYSYYENGNGEIVLTDIIGDVPENWVCPSMYEGKKVVGLGDHFLAESEEIRSVVLADTIREVGEKAFKKCPNLSSVILNEGLEIIRGYAFRKCFSLESVILPSSISIVEERAFCRSGENYRWDEGEGIGIHRIEIRGGENDAFSCEDGVLYDKINKKVIMARANIERVVLPEDCTRIGDCAFLSCYNLNEVVWNTALLEIGDEAFAGTYLTTGDLSKTSLALAQEQAFAGCPLKEVVLPATLQTVGSHLFGLCDSLESVRFLGNAPAIDNSAEETEEGFPDGDIYVTVSGEFVGGEDDEEEPYNRYLPNVTTYIEKGTSGWGAVPGTWQGCPIAYWGTLTETVYEMSFASGGAAEGDVPEVISFKADEEVELPGCGSLSWSKHTFVGWSDGISTYDSGAIYTGESNVVMTAQWARNELAAPVIFAPETFETDSCEVMITCDSAAAIHYTLDGADPTIESPIYTGPIMITGTTEIKAIAIRDNYFDSSIASFTVTRGVWTFGEYLNWSGQEFTTSGDVEWIREKGVSDDGYALKSGKIQRNQKSCLTTTVQGAGTISFMLKVSSEADEETSEPYDGFVLAVDGVDVTELIGGEIDWRRVSFKIVGDGLHNIEWRYEKDKSVDSGEDCAWIDEVMWSPDDPIPDLGTLATASEVAAALSGSADANLAENIKTAVEYATYREWALNLEGVTPQQVKDSPNAWLSYALDADVLIAAAPKEGDVVIDTFESAATDGAFEFTVKIDGIEVGDNALESNIMKVFSIEGAEKLDMGDERWDMSNVEVNAAASVNGNVKFTVTPKIEGGKKPNSFFFRVKMK